MRSRRGSRRACDRARARCGQRSESSKMRGRARQRMQKQSRDFRVSTSFVAPRHRSGTVSDCVAEACSHERDASRAARRLSRRPLARVLGHLKRCTACCDLPASHASQEGPARAAGGTPTRLDRRRAAQPARHAAEEAARGEHGHRPCGPGQHPLRLQVRARLRLSAHETANGRSRRSTARPACAMSSSASRTSSRAWAAEVSS